MVIMLNLGIFHRSDRYLSDKADPCDLVFITFSIAVTFFNYLFDSKIQSFSIHYIFFSFSSSTEIGNNTKMDIECFI